MESRRDTAATDREEGLMTEPQPLSKAALTGAGDDPTASDYRDALVAVLEALDIPHAAVGDEQKRTAILLERTGHVVVMLESILRNEHPAPDMAWSVAYLRDRLAEHPATGYRTWDERVAELDAAKAQEGDGRSADHFAGRPMGVIIRPIFGGRS